MATRPAITKLVALVFAVQLILGVAVSSLEHTRLEPLSMVCFYLGFFGVPVAYFLVLRNAQLFGASSRGGQIATAAISGVLLWFLGVVVVVVVILICFPR